MISSFYSKFSDKREKNISFKVFHHVIFHLIPSENRENFNKIDQKSLGSKLLSIKKKIEILLESKFDLIFCSPSFRTISLLFSWGSLTVTVSLNPCKCRAQAHKSPIIPAPNTSTLSPTLIGAALSQPWAKHDKGSLSAAWGISTPFGTWYTYWSLQLQTCSFILIISIWKRIWAHLIFWNNGVRRPSTIPKNSNGVVDPSTQAEMVIASMTVVARIAAVVGIDGDGIADFKIFHRFANRFHDACEFVSQGQGTGFFARKWTLQTKDSEVNNPEEKRDEDFLIFFNLLLKPKIGPKWTHLILHAWFDETIEG